MKTMTLEELMKTVEASNHEAWYKLSTKTPYLR